MPQVSRTRIAPPRWVGLALLSILFIGGCDGIGSDNPRPGSIEVPPDIKVGGRERGPVGQGAEGQEPVKGAGNVQIKGNR